MGVPSIIALLCLGRLTRDALAFKFSEDDEIAQAEIGAHFRNDPDAAIDASKKLGGDFILRGLITTQTGGNPLLKINEVAIHMGFALISPSGRSISNVTARADSYSGTDTLGMAPTLTDEQADEVVAKLYNDYCRTAGGN